MKKAGYSDLKNMVEVLDQAFVSDPHVAWFIGNPISPLDAQKKRRVLMKFLCTSAISCGQAWLSDNGKAVALWKDQNFAPSGWKYLTANLHYLFAMGIPATTRSLRMEQKTDSYFPDSPWLFLWTIGILPEAQGTGLFKAMIAPVLEEAHKEGRPVLLETTVQKNVDIYSHYGFEVIDSYTFCDSPKVFVMRHP